MKNIMTADDLASSLVDFIRKQNYVLANEYGVETLDLRTGRKIGILKNTPTYKRIMFIFKKKLRRQFVGIINIESVSKVTIRYYGLSSKDETFQLANLIRTNYKVAVAVEIAEEYVCYEPKD